MTYNCTRPTERLLKYPLIFLYYLKIKIHVFQKKIYIYILYYHKKKNLGYIKSFRVKSTAQTTFYSSTRVLFFLFSLLPLLSQVFFWHEDKSPTQVFIETLFFLYQVNKRIIIYQKEVSVPSFRQVFFFFFFSINPIQII